MSSRPRNKAAAVLAAALGTSLAGCSDIYYDRRESIAAHAGDSVMTNQVTHMVDPWSRASANRNLAFNGERMQGAVERHRRHTIIRPVNPVTAGSESQPQPPPPITTEQIPGQAPNGQAASASAAGGSRKP
jgi:hypothetical protein